MEVSSTKIPPTKQCAVCGVDLRAAQSRRPARLAHERGLIHRAAVAGHGLIRLYRRDYGHRWVCRCGAQGKLWVRTRRQAWDGWVEHLPSDVRVIVSISRALPVGAVEAAAVRDPAP